LTVSGSWVGSSVGEIETHDDFDEEPCMHSNVRTIKYGKEKNMDMKKDCALKIDVSL